MVLSLLLSSPRRVVLNADRLPSLFLDQYTASSSHHHVNGSRPLAGAWHRRGSLAVSDLVTSSLRDSNSSFVLFFNSFSFGAVFLPMVIIPTFRNPSQYPSYRRALPHTLSLFSGQGLWPPGPGLTLLLLPFLKYAYCELTFSPPISFSFSLLIVCILSLSSTRSQTHLRRDSRIPRSTASLGRGRTRSSSPATTAERPRTYPRRVRS